MWPQEARTDLPWYLAAGNRTTSRATASGEFVQEAACGAGDVSSVSRGRVAPYRAPARPAGRACYCAVGFGHTCVPRATTPCACAVATSPLLSAESSGRWTESARGERRSISSTGRAISQS